MQPPKETDDYPERFLARFYNYRRQIFQLSP